MDTTDLWRERVDDLFTTSWAASRGIGERELRRVSPREPYGISRGASTPAVPYPSGPRTAIAS